MKPFLALAFGIALYGSHAAGAPNFCTDEGSTEAKAIHFQSGDPAILDGVNVSLQLGLEPPSFPWKEIRESSETCIRGDITADDRRWTVFGENKSFPPRWATTEGDNRRVALLAQMPRAEDAHKWAEGQRANPTREKSVRFSNWMWALTIATGDRREVYGFYDRIPDDTRLKVDLTAALEGRTPVELSYDMKSHSIVSNDH